MNRNDLESLFPNDYSKKLVGLSNKYELVTDENFYDFCTIANNQFNYLYTNRELSGFYFVDFRCNFWELQKYILLNLSKITDTSIILVFNGFLNNYELAGDILYERFEEQDTKNTNLSDFS